MEMLFSHHTSHTINNELLPLEETKKKKMTGNSYHLLTTIDVMCNFNCVSDLIGFVDIHQISTKFCMHL